MQTHEEYMQKAISLSANNLHTLVGGPFGCVIVKNGEILSAEANSVIRDCDPTAHAEINAIRKAAVKIGTPDLSDCVLYSSAEPCPMCLSAIYWSNIKHVYYGNSKRDAAWAGFGDAFIAEQLKKKTDDQAIVFERICAEDAFSVFEKWQAGSSEIKTKIDDLLK